MTKSEFATCLSLLRSIGLSNLPHIDEIGYVTTVNIEDTSIVFFSYKSAAAYLENNCKYSKVANSYDELVLCLTDLSLL